MADIFISYARPDRGRIEQLAAALEAEGYSVWWDRQIVGGSEFSEEIERELDAAKAVVVAWSENSAKSRWVKDEAATAAEAQKLVPISIDGSLAPMGFRQFHVIDIEDWNGKSGDADFQELSRTIKARLTGVAAPAVQPKTKKKKKSELDLQKLLTTAIVFAGIVAIVWVANPGDRRSQPASVSTPQNTSPQRELETAQTPVLPSLPTAEPPPQASIAVLPFADLSPEGDQEYFSDGIAEEILNVLVRVDGLSVASRTSAFRFKGDEKSIPVIANELGVAHVLEGSVRKAGNRIRITAQLISAGSDVHLWSETYDRELSAENIFGIQDEIAKQIATSLRGELSLGEIDNALAAKASTTNLGAYELYLKAQNLPARLDAEWISARVGYLEEAVALAPDYADAWTALANAYTVLPGWTTGITNEEAQTKALEAVNRALALNPALHEAKRVLALINAALFNWEAAITEFDQIIEADASYAETKYSYGIVLLALGYVDRALPLLENSVALSPTDGFNQHFYALALAADGQFDVAERGFIRAHEIGYRGSVWAPLSELAFIDGRYDEYRFRLAEFYDHLNHAPLSQYVARVRMAPPEDQGAELERFWQIAADLGFNRQSLIESADIREDGGIGLWDAIRFGHDELLSKDWPLAFYPWNWGPNNAAGRKTEGFREMLRIAKMPDYWRAHGWPDKCRPIGDDDFECE